MTNQELLEQQVLVWPDVTAHSHRFGGVEFRLGRREIGHYHRGIEVVDIPFPKRVRNEIIEAGLAEPHHVLPDSGWISKWLREPEDVSSAVLLLRRSFDLAREQAEQRAKRAASA